MAKINLEFTLAEEKDEDGNVICALGTNLDEDLSYNADLVDEGIIPMSQIINFVLLNVAADREEINRLLQKYVKEPKVKLQEEEPQDNVIIS